MAKKSKTVRVQIEAKEVLHYTQIVNMTPEEWEEVKSCQDNGGEGLARLINGWLDKHDPTYADDIEDDEVEVSLAK